MTNRNLSLYAIGVLVAWLPALVSAQPPADQQAIRQAADAFVAAFNHADAKGVAACWTEQGEFVDERGQSHVGHAAIEQVYAEFFRKQPGTKLKLAIDSLRMVSPGTVIEDGRTVVEPAAGGDAIVGKYSAVHIKQDGKWLMASVRDLPAEALSGHGTLQDLQWLVGSWSAEEHGTKLDLTYRWIADQRFLEKTYTVTRPDKSTSSGVQIIGWNPQWERIQSWTFSSDGGHAQGIWTPVENGWAIETVGTLADGTDTSSLNLISRLDDNAAATQSVQRSVGQSSLPDTDEVVVKRKASAP